MADHSTKCPTDQQTKTTLGPSMTLFLKEGQLDRITAQGVKLVSPLPHPNPPPHPFFFPLFLYSISCPLLCYLFVVLLISEVVGFSSYNAIKTLSFMRTSLQETFPPSYSSSAGATLMNHHVGILFLPGRV